MERRAGWAGLGAVALAAFALYALRLLAVAHLAGQGVGLHVDEAQYWDWSRDLAWGYYSKPPVIAALIAASTALFGDGVLAVKALAMACYPLTALALYGLGRELAGPRVGAVAALLYAVTPFAGLLGLAATTDAPLLLCWTLALWALWRAHRQPTLARWLLLGLACGVGVLSKYTAAAFSVTALGFVLHGVWRDGVPLWPRLRGLLIAAAVAAVVVAPNLAWNASHGWPTLRHTAEITATKAANSPSRAVAKAAEFGIGQVLLAGPVAALWALSLRRRRAAEAPAAPRRLALWAALPLLGIGLAQAWHAGAEVNWAAPSLAGLLLALALAAAPRANAGRWLLACAAVQLGLVFAVALAGDLARLGGHDLPPRLDVWTRMRGWQPAFDTLRGPIAARPGALVIATERGVVAQGAYGLRGTPVRWAAWSADGGVHSQYQLMHPLPADLSNEPQLLVLAEAPLPPAFAARFPKLKPLASATVPFAADRRTTLQLWEVAR
jgi:4-amino-4-deoxy-L-arabinose transferase-like glycosyltransferase